MLSWTKGPVAAAVVPSLISWEQTTDPSLCKPQARFPLTLTWLNVPLGC
jgi:hypothetical protein